MRDTVEAELATNCLLWLKSQGTWAKEPFHTNLLNSDELAPLPSQL